MGFMPFEYNYEGGALVGGLFFDFGILISWIQVVASSFGALLGEIFLISTYLGT